MFTPSPSTTIVVPIKAGPESELGVKVTSDYFGQVPPDRLVVKDDVIYFCADGKYRSKIGINPKRSKARVWAATTRTTRCSPSCSSASPPASPITSTRSGSSRTIPTAAMRPTATTTARPRPGAKPMGPFLRAGILFPGRRAGAGQEPLAHPSHDPSERAGIRAGWRRPRHAGRVPRRHQSRAQESVKCGAASSIRSARAPLAHASRGLAQTAALQAIPHPN